MAIEATVETVTPEAEAYIASGMTMFDLPGLAIGIVANDRLVYSKGFGVRSKGGGAPVDTRTIFQIGSTTKAFLAATIAIMVDRGKLKWDDRVVDLYPDFQMKDPWVTREFRVFDLLAQRSGLPAYANDARACSASTRPRDPVAALCRSDVEFPDDVRLHQHHPPPREPHRRACRQVHPDWNDGPSEAICSIRSA